jgi:NADH dehydrogenase [ubiquinone] 1 alpha subcomplex assembly factor 3
MVVMYINEDGGGETAAFSAGSRLSGPLGGPSSWILDPDFDDGTWEPSLQHRPDLLLSSLSITHISCAQHIAMERCINSCSKPLMRSLRPNCAQRTALRKCSSTFRPSIVSRRQPCAPPQSAQLSYHRCIHTTRPLSNASPPPKTRDRGPKSNEDTQTDFGAMDVLRHTAAPATSIDACTDTGFALNNQTRLSGSGILLVGGEAFRWRPWIQDGGKGGTTEDDAMTGRIFNKKGQWEVPEAAWGVLDLVFPKPGMAL